MRLQWLAQKNQLPRSVSHLISSDGKCNLWWSTKNIEKNREKQRRRQKMKVVLLSLLLIVPMFLGTFLTGKYSTFATFATFAILYKNVNHMFHWTFYRPISYPTASIQTRKWPYVWYNNRRKRRMLLELWSGLNWTPGGFIQRFPPNPSWLPPWLFSKGLNSFLSTFKITLHWPHFWTEIESFFHIHTSSFLLLYKITNYP